MFIEIYDIIISFASKGGANLFTCLLITIELNVYCNIIKSNASKGGANLFTFICINIELNHLY